MNNYFYDKDGNLLGSSEDVIGKLEKENKENIEFAKFMMDCRDELIKENAELKEQLEDLRKGDLRK